MTAQNTRSSSGAPSQQVTLKATRRAQQWLRQIAAATGERQYQVLERLLGEEWAHQQKASRAHEN